MFHCPVKSLLTLFLVVAGVNVNGQTTTLGSNPRNGRENNPYSMYGLGEIKNGNNAVLRGMGNITSAYYSGFQVNTDNPASYSFLKRTTFEVGAVASTRTIHGDLNGTNKTYKTGTATLAYMNIAFPVGKNGGLCLGFRPHSAAYYRLYDTIKAGTSPLAPYGDEVKQMDGEGALNYAFIGAGRKFKGLSVGFNAGYMFGTYRNTSVIYDPSQNSINNSFSSVFSDYTRLGGIHWKGGLLYEAKLDSTHTLRIGGTVNMSQKLTERYSEYHISTFNFGDTVIRDTSVNTGEQQGKLTLPLSYSIGFMFTRTGKWGIGADYTATQWNLLNSASNTQINRGVASSSYKVSVGGEYTPDAENIKNYFSRATYRLGAYYGSDYLQINNNSIPFYGLTAGFSLPFKRSLSQIHCAVDAGVLGTTENNLMKHNYVRFTLGASLNDLWFVRRKIE